MSDINQAEDVSQLSEERAGSLVWWNIHETLAADPMLLQLSFKQNAPHLVGRLPACMEPFSAARDAMQGCRASRPKGSDWEEIGETHDELKLAFTVEERDVDLETFASRQAMVVRIHKTTGDVTTAPPRDQLVNGEAAQLDTFAEKYLHARRMLLHKALTRFTTTVILDDQKARRAKTHGGLFFVRGPIKDADGNVVEKGLDEGVFDLMTAMKPAGMELVVVEVGAERAGQFAGGIEQSFLADIAKLAGGVQKRLDQLKDSRKLSREDTFTTRLTELETIKKEAKVYGQLIGMATDHIDSAVAGASELTSRVLEDMKKALAEEAAKNEAAKNRPPAASAAPSELVELLP